MDVYVIRHGKAEDQSESGLDRDRALRKKGRRQSEWLGEWISGGAELPAMVLASPYVRAQQTGEAIWRRLGMEAQTDDRLGAERSLSDVIDVLRDARGVGCVALVGHNPNCARLVSALCRGLTAMPGGHRTGELAHVRVDGDGLIGDGTLIERVRMGD